jgi:WD40 repeat protein
MKVWDLKTGQCIREFPGIGKETCHICKILNDKIMTCSADQHFRIWDIEAGKLIKKFNFKGYTTTCLRAVSDDKFLTGGVMKYSESKQTLKKFYKFDAKTL